MCVILALFLAVFRIKEFRKYTKFNIVQKKLKIMQRKKTVSVV